MMQLIDYCRHEPNIEQLLELPDVKERVDLFMEHRAKFEEQILRCTNVHGPLAVLDLRDEEGHLCRQPLYDLCIVPRDKYFLPSHVGQSKAKYSYGFWQIYF